MSRKRAHIQAMPRPYGGFGRTFDVYDHPYGTKLTVTSWWGEELVSYLAPKEARDLGEAIAASAAAAEARYAELHALEDRHRQAGNDDA